MTLANKITISRFLFIPAILIFAFLGAFIDYFNYELFLNVSVGQIIFIFLFIIASLTDFLDGYFARKRHEVTVFGKFLDPILDKILVLSTLNSLFFYHYFNEDLLLRALLITTNIVIITREFFVSGIRLVAVYKRQVIAASIWGKIKTASTMVALIILGFNSFNLRELTKQKYCYLSISLLVIIMLLTVVSGIDMVIKSKVLLKKVVSRQSNEFSFNKSYFIRLK